MKKTAIWLLVLTLAFGLLGCSQKGGTQPTQTPSATQGTKPQLTTLADQALLQFMKDSGITPPAVLSEGETDLMDCLREAVTQAEADPDVDFSGTNKDREIGDFMNEIRDAVNAYYGRK